MNQPRKNIYVGNSRSGVVVPLIALLLVVLIGLVALVVDYGIILSAKQELQNAADAAAVATMETYNSDFDFADLAAFESLSANDILNRTVVFDMARDVEYGTWDRDAQIFTAIPRNGSPGTEDTSGRTIPFGANAVRVNLQRTESLGNGIRLFFAPIIGADFADISGEAIASAPANCAGFVGLESADLRNRLTTDSYDSDLGDYDAHAPFGGEGVNRFASGDVCSNGPVTIASGAQINGNAGGNPVNVIPGSGAHLSGTRSVVTEPLEFDPVDFSDANFNNNDNIERGPLWAPPFFTSQGDLVVNNGRNLTLQEGTYLFRNLTVAGGSRLEINGEVKIYVQGAATLDNGTRANPSGVPSNFELFVGQGPVNLQGGNALHASIYAPQAAVNVGNNASFFGAIIGRTLTVAGGAQLHYDLALADNVTPPLPAVLVF